MNELMTRPSGSGSGSSGKDGKGGMRRVAVSSDGVSEPLLPLHAVHYMTFTHTLTLHYLHTVYVYIDSYFPTHWHYSN